MKRLLLLCVLTVSGCWPAPAQTGAPAPAQPVNTAPPAAASEKAPATPVGTPAATPAPTPAAPVAAAAPGVSRGRTVTLPPEKASPVRVPRLDHPPVIDGKLDDAVWQQAAVFRDFYQVQPGDNIAPSKPTEMFMGYDARTLYFAFHVYDEPDKVRATVPKRDNVFDDDYVGMFLDTFNDQRKAYVLFFSPLGVQADGILTDGRNEDYSPDIVMESKGTLTADGYVVEIAIPFKSLRYEAGRERVWGAHFFRRIKRFNNELDSWMPLSRDISGTLVQAGHLTGFEGISTERTLDLIPSLTLSETGARVRAVPPQPFPQIGPAPPVDNGRFVNRPLALDLGLTAKYTLTPTVTLDFAYNPDFAQVEADATVVTANQRFPIFFEEKRPFFLEGKEIFDTLSRVVHTRAIIDPDFAVKLTGKRGRNTFGLILASDAAPGNFNEDERTAARERAQRDPAHPPAVINLFDRNASVGVLRFKRDVGREHSLGLFATSYNFVDRHNQLFGLDGRFKLDPQTVASFEVIGTSSSRCASSTQTDARACTHGNGFGYAYSYDVTKRHYGWIFQGNGRTRFYRADVGFTRRTDTNNANFGWRISSEPNPRAKLISVALRNGTSANFNWRAQSQAFNNGTTLNFGFAHETFAQVGVNFGYERLFASEFGGRFAGQDQERQSYPKNAFVFAETTLSKQYSGYVFAGTTRGAFDFDFGGGPRFPRVSLAALADPNSALDPGPGQALELDMGVTYQPTNALRAQFSYNKSRLARYDTGRVAFDDNIFVVRATYQFTRFTFARARVDFDSLTTNVRGQFLLGWAPNPGTSVYVGYNDDLNRNGLNPFSNNLEPGFRRNGRTFFLKLSYLFRRSFGG